MFHPEWEDGCPSCSAGTDELSPGFFEHLHTRDTSYAMVSRAPLANLERWKAKKGWDVPWYSSSGTDFNYDFGATIDESVTTGEHNYRTKAEYEAMGSEFFSSDQPFDMPGRSCFLLVDGRVFHTYSQYARGLESTGGSYGRDRDLALVVAPRTGDGAVDKEGAHRAMPSSVVKRTTSIRSSTACTSAVRSPPQSAASAAVAGPKPWRYRRTRCSVAASMVRPAGGGPSQSSAAA